MRSKKEKLNMNYFHKGKRVFGSAIFLFVLSASLFSCKKEATDVGLNIQPEDDIFNSSVIDTFGIESYTVLEDSLRTDELANVVVGSYVDPVFGKTTSTIYTQFGLGLPTSTVDLISVDSVRLQIKYAGKYANLDPQKFTVQRVTEKFYKDSPYYSNSVLTTDGIELVIPASATVTPNLTDTVYVGASGYEPMLILNLDTIVGKDILTAIPGGNLATQTAFDNFFYGLRIGVDNPGQSQGQGGLLYMNMLHAQTKMIIYYTSSTGAQQMSFPVGANQARFSSFTHDYTGTVVESAINTPALGQQFFYAQTMQGVEGVIKIKGIDDIKNLGNVMINKAEVVLPIQYFTTDVYTPTGNAFLFYKTADGESVTTDQLSNAITYGGVYDDTKKAYVFNIGKHVQALVKGDIDNLGFVVNTSASSVAGGRIIFNGQGTPNREKPYLKVYYTKY